MPYVPILFWWQASCSILGAPRSRTYDCRACLRGKILWYGWQKRLSGEVELASKMGMAFSTRKHRCKCSKDLWLFQGFVAIDSLDICSHDSFFRIPRYPRTSSIPLYNPLSCSTRDIMQPDRFCLYLRWNWWNSILTSSAPGNIINGRMLWIE